MFVGDEASGVECLDEHGDRCNLIRLGESQLGFAGISKVCLAIPREICPCYFRSKPIGNLSSVSQFKLCVRCDDY